MPLKEKTTKQRRRWLTIFLSSIFVLVFFAFLLIYLPRINQIELKGTHQMTVEDFLQMSGMKKNEHIFSIDKEKITENIRKNPYYSAEEINYVFPSTLSVKILQREDDACLRYLDHDIVIARDGTVLKIGGRDEYPTILRLQGVSVTGYALGELLGVQDEYQMNTLSKLLVLLYDSDYRGDYQIVDISNPVDIKLLSKNRITVRIGQMEDLNTKLFRSARVLRELVLEGTVGGIIDASTDMVSYRSSGEGEIEIPDEMGLSEEYVLPAEDSVSQEEAAVGEGMETEEQLPYELPSAANNTGTNGGNTNANRGEVAPSREEEPPAFLSDEVEIFDEEEDAEPADLPDIAEE